MAGVRILVVQPSDLAPPRKLGEWLSEAGADLDLIVPSRQRLPEDLSGYSAVVVLGGEMGALDDATHPWLGSVRRLLGQAVSHRVPVLAICLGAQLLAVATGGQVRAVRQGPEAGTLLVAKRDVAAEDPLLASLPLTPDVLQFHSDEIAVLPPTAKLLASSPKCENQIFRVGECAYALQFHIETATDVVRSWTQQMPEVAAAARAGHWEEEHLDAFHAEMAETWQPVAEEFVRIAGTPPEERRTNRLLPLA